MWGIVGELKRHFGSTWPEEAVVLDFSQTERLDLVSLQGCPKLIVVLLSLNGVKCSHIFMVNLFVYR